MMAKYMDKVYYTEWCRSEIQEYPNLQITKWWLVVKVVGKVLKQKIWHTYDKNNSITETVGFSNSFKDIVHHAAGHPVELWINTIYTVCLVSQASTANPEPLHELNQALKRSDSVVTSERFTNWILMPEAKRWKLMDLKNCQQKLTHLCKE